jgi:hypothetical protein
LHHWGILFTGGIGIGAVSLWQITGHYLSPTLGWVIAAFAVLGACFKAWNEQFERAESLDEPHANDPLGQLPTPSPALPELESAIPPEKEETPILSIDVVDARVTTITHDAFGSYSEYANGFPAVVISFKNQLARPGRQNETFTKVTANIAYEGTDRTEHIDYGNWLEEYTRFVDFNPGETHDLVIAKKYREDGKVVGLYNQKKTDPRKSEFHHTTRTIHGPDELLLPSPPCRVTVTLVSREATLFSQTYVLDWIEDGELKFVTADQASRGAEGITPTTR